MKILAIEDDIKISKLIQKGLSEAGFEVDAAFDGEHGLSLGLSQRYDLLIIDIMLPKIDGLEIVSRLRRQGVDSPVLILSAKRSIDDRVSGLQSGGDDYVVKPFAFAELLARIQALLRRSIKAIDAAQISSGSVSVDLLSRTVLRDGKKIELQAKEFSLLEYFLRNPGQVITKTQILERVWNYKFDPQTNVVDVLVCRLRNKLDKGFSEKTIQTVRGIGYIFKGG